MLEPVLAQVSVDRIRAHIQSLGGVRHPTAAPQALEQAADYIQASLDAPPYQVELHPFQDEGRAFRNILATRPGARHPEERWKVGSVHRNERSDGICSPRSGCWGSRAPAACEDATGRAHGVGSMCVRMDPWTDQIREGSDR